MQVRLQHQQEVQAFLQQHLSNQGWDFTLPRGSGNETYFAHSSEFSCFVKLGVHLSRYEAMASIGLTPPVLAAGTLADGTSILIQPYIAGRSLTRKDYRDHLEQIAGVLNRTHHSTEVKGVLPEVSSELYRASGLESFEHLQQKWERFRPQVPNVADFVDESLEHLRKQVNDFQGSGLVASHNDICNANWLLSSEGELYLIDLESMRLDDPAVDIGATLWWYYPPERRQQFLRATLCADDPMLQTRMRVRMAMHCLNITLPRPQSFDKFDPTSFAESLTDFRAILAGKENPQGYDER